MDREVHVVDSVEATDPDEVAGEVIQSAVQVVDTVAELGEKRVRHGVRMDRVIRVLECTFFHFGFKAVQSDLTYRSEFDVESLLMALCPPHLEVYGMQIGRLRPLVMVGHAVSSTNARQGAGDANHTEGYADPNTYAGGVRRQSREAS
jgi:hypothetical protein